MFFNRTIEALLWHMVIITPMLAASSFVHEQNDNRTCKHRSRIYIYIICVDEECAGTDIWHGSHYSNMGSFIVRACSYVMNPYTALLQCTKLSIDSFFFVMNRCSSNGNVSTVHELYTWYMYTYHYEKGARSHPYDTSSRAFVHARMWCTRVLYHFNVLSWPLAISFFVHEQMLFLNPWNPQLSYCCHVDDRLRFRCP